MVNSFFLLTNALIYLLDKEQYQITTYLVGKKLENKKYLILEANYSTAEQVIKF